MSRRHPIIAAFGCQQAAFLVAQVSDLPRLLFALSALALLPALAAPATAEPARPPQYVLISFDGAGPVEQWRRSRALAQETGASFTYFLSCVYLITRDTRSLYQPPRHAAGRSNVGFAASAEEVGLRLAEIWTARAEGHEIASHGCGHFDGKDWTAKDWRQEFSEFSRIVADAWTINGIDGEPAGWRDFVRDGIGGFRAPYLSIGAGLFEALALEGFSYDASGVSRGPVAPSFDPALDRIARFALPMVPEGPSARPVIAMDYNLFVRHSGGEEREDEGGAFEARALDAFRAAFDRQYEGERVPLQIGLHFTLMNGGAYWRALERFSRDVCTMEDVRCVSYRTYLDETGEGGDG